MKRSTKRGKGTVLILGLGFVGQANAIALIRTGYDVYAYDPARVKNLYQVREFDRIQRIEMPRKVTDKKLTIPVIVCVNAKNDARGKQDLTYAKAALAAARRLSTGPVMLRSTILPANLGRLDFDLYVPEFLHEKHAIAEVLEPELIVIGKRSSKKRAPLPRFLAEWQRSVPAANVFIGTPEEAAHIKYLHNVWNALRIAFVNEIGDAIAKEGGRHEAVIDFLFKGAYYLRYGGPFDGHCLPKDTEAFARAYDALIATAMLKSNAKHAAFAQNRRIKPKYHGIK